MVLDPTGIVKRSNVESTDSALKRTLPEELRTEKFIGQTNEALAKMVAYDLRVLVREVRKGSVDLDPLAETLRFGDCIRSVVNIRKGQSLEWAA